MVKKCMLGIGWNMKRVHLKNTINNGRVILNMYLKEIGSDDEGYIY
jgi:hypothetical protein